MTDETTYYEVRRHEDAHEPADRTIGTTDLITALRTATYEALRLERGDDDFAFNGIQLADASKGNYEPKNDDLFEIYPIRGHGTVVVAETDEI